MPIPYLHLNNLLSRVIPARSHQVFRFASFRRKYLTSENMALPSGKAFVWRRYEKATSKKPAEEQVEIAFDYKAASGNLERITMVRPLAGDFESTKSRIQHKIGSIHNPQLKKKTKKAKMDAEVATEVPAQDSVTVSITDSSGQLSVADKTGVTNFDAFYDEKSSRLCINSAYFQFVRNFPYIEKLALALSPIVGCPVPPSLDWRQDCDPPTSVDFQWYVTNEANISIASHDDEEFLTDPDFTFAGNGEFFCPAKEHAGKWLHLRLKIQRDEDWAIKSTAFRNHAVMDLDGEFMFEKRQREHCAEKLVGNRCRFVSYNVLADLYLDLKQEQSNLFFPYCPKEYQPASYRYPVVLKELKGYNADLMFLQEVDFRFYKRFLENFLSECGFTSEFQSKANVVNEGLVIAYNISKFRQVTSTSPSMIRLSELIDTDKYPENTDIVSLLDHQEHAPIKALLFEKPTVVQLVLIETLNGKPVLAVNTHLVCDPAYEMVKTIQALLCVRFISRIKKELDLRDIQILFAGDFNSLPDSAVVQLFTQGFVDAENPVWSGMGLSAKEDCIYESLAGYPEYTNYTKWDTDLGFCGCIDYIWASPAVSVEKVVPMPDHSLVTKHTAIPSAYQPSDHLPLICDVKI
ncbi:endonuclease/Exonuclease/phosphatase family domain-containing protein [Ditylenchus destructor]|uniref:Endonuclease/Exonuclease/phosphatase family domain-containing protein n=1 Tax=Ditylenchus destructor TaxID=166010 RepID=A0AAD4RBX5_9BILA|nr:endonuclease/Exonuclease/phosphatase family domain-containing protein [Ditylenchus destructor]